MKPMEFKGIVPAATIVIRVEGANVEIFEPGRLVSSAGWRCDFLLANGREVELNINGEKSKIRNVLGQALFEDSEPMSDRYAREQVEYLQKQGFPEETAAYLKRQMGPGQIRPAFELVESLMSNFEHPSPTDIHRVARSLVFVITRVERRPRLLNYLRRFYLARDTYIACSDAVVDELAQLTEQRLRSILRGAVAIAKDWSKRQPVETETTPLVEEFASV